MEQEIKIQSILAGHSATLNFGSQGQFSASLGIDPDFPATDTETNISGYIRPTSMEKFSASVVDSAPMWISTNPKNELVYVYLYNGTLLSYSSSLGSETKITTGITTAIGNGMEYYNNYLYVSANTDTSRYGPLDGTPAFTAGWFFTNGGNQLTHTTYPAIRGIKIPNHPMCRHLSSGVLYVGDVQANSGCLHFIDTVKGTYEGDTEDNTTFNALDFGYGLYPTAIEAYGTDLVVGLIEGTGTTISQKRAKLTFWDTTSDSFTQIHEEYFPDPLITAIKNVNGVLWVFSGSASGGCRVSRFVGGYTCQEVAYLEDAYPPFQGAVDHILNRVVFGSAITYPSTAACVFAIGSKSAKLGMGVQNILKSTSSGATPLATAVKYVQNSAFPLLSPIVGFSDASAKGIDKRSTTYGTSTWRSEKFKIGKPFSLKEVLIPLAQAVAANMTLTVKAYFDDASSNTTLATINSTNFPNSERLIRIRPAELRAFHNFFIELAWSGTALLTVALPITIRMNVYDA